MTSPSTLVLLQGTLTAPSGHGSNQCIGRSGRPMSGKALHMYSVGQASAHAQLGMQTAPLEASAQTGRCVVCWPCQACITLTGWDLSTMSVSRSLML